MAFQALRASQTTSSELKGLFKKVNDSTIPISEKNIQTNITSLKGSNIAIANFDSVIQISENNIQTNITSLKG